jgi:hypothetical protein
MGARQSDLTRRGFLDRAGRLAAGGFTAAAIVDRPRSEVVRAQALNVAPVRRPQSVSLIGVDHYHATSTPNYLLIRRLR